MYIYICMYIYIYMYRDLVHEGMQDLHHQQLHTSTLLLMVVAPRAATSRPVSCGLCSNRPGGCAAWVDACRDMGIALRLFEARTWSAHVLLSYGISSTQSHYLGATSNSTHVLSSLTHQGKPGQAPERASGGTCW